MKNKRFALLIVLICLIFHSLSNFCYAAQKPLPAVPQKVDPETALYQKAQLELDKDLYRVYRIAERLIRANKLDDYPWVIEISREKEYKTDAYTKEGNLIVLDIGIINTFSEDVSALAFFISHEMAHQLKKHLYKETKYQIEIEKKIEEGNIPLNSDLKSRIREDSAIGGIVYPFLYTYNMERIEQEKQRQEDIIKDLNAEISALLRKHEYEADKTGLHFMIKAGFDGKSSLRVNEFFKRMPLSTLEEDSSHPDSKNRLNRIQNELDTLDMTAMKKEGSKNVAVSKPLTYEKTLFKRNNQTIIKRAILINSRYGLYNDINDPFKKMFGK